MKSVIKSNFQRLLDNWVIKKIAKTRKVMENELKKNEIVIWTWPGATSDFSDGSQIMYNDSIMSYDDEDWKRKFRHFNIHSIHNSTENNNHVDVLQANRDGIIELLKNIFLRLSVVLHHIHSPVDCNREKLKKICKRKIMIKSRQLYWYSMRNVNISVFGFCISISKFNYLQDNVSTFIDFA